MSKSRMYPCLRPQSTQRRTTRHLNFGVRVARTLTDVRAIKGRLWVEWYQLELLTHSLLMTIMHQCAYPCTQYNTRIAPKIKQKQMPRPEAGAFVFTYKRLSYFTSSFFNGRPRYRKNASDSDLVLAVVTIVTAKPNTSLSSSSAHSGKIECSLIPRV